MSQQIAHTVAQLRKRLHLLFNWRIWQKMPDLRSRQQDYVEYFYRLSAASFTVAFRQ